MSAQRVGHKGWAGVAPARGKGGEEEEGEEKEEGEEEEEEEEGKLVFAAGRLTPAPRPGIS